MLDTGQVSLHDIYLIHGSEANRSAKPRRGMTLRYMPTTSTYRRDLADGRRGGPLSMAERTPLPDAWPRPLGRERLPHSLVTPASRAAKRRRAPHCGQLLANAASSAAKDSGSPYSPLAAAGRVAGVHDVLPMATGAHVGVGNSAD